MQYTSLGSESTKKLAVQIAQQFLKNGQVFKGGVIALIGDLGSGKTTFTQGFAKALGVRDKIISPTFVLQREHKIPNSNFVLYHLDLYRLENDDQFKQLGLDELFDPIDKIVLIEWAQKIIKYLPKSTQKIYFQQKGKNTRQITTP